MSDNIGATRFAHLARRIEQQIREQLFEEIPGSVHRLVGEFDQVRQALHEYVGRISRE
jgi:HPt (histidine-containing phosphotransfer) domain-containing protein